MCSCAALDCDSSRCPLVYNVLCRVFFFKKNNLICSSRNGTTPSLQVSNRHHERRNARYCTFSWMPGQHQSSSWPATCTSDAGADSEDFSAACGQTITKYQSTAEQQQFSSLERNCGARAVPMSDTESARRRSSDGSGWMDRHWRTDGHRFRLHAKGGVRRYVPGITRAVAA